MIQVVHVRERTTVVVQPRSEVVQVRQVAGMAQSVIQALVLAQQLADPAPNLSHPCRAPISSSSAHSHLSRICLESVSLWPDRSTISRDRVLSQILQKYICTNYITVRDFALALPRHFFTLLRFFLLDPLINRNGDIDVIRYKKESDDGETLEFSLDVNHLLKSI